MGVRRGSSSLKVALLGVVEGGLVILKVAFLGDRRESSSRKVTFLGVIEGGLVILKVAFLGKLRGSSSLKGNIYGRQMEELVSKGSVFGRWRIRTA